ncbi:rCG62921 [Rattus norvegicus]|uniref:RCG62921 n=1 Tax=Rattus norvegicus TaxID=10116 RepID=A6I3U0_RAT|nr:rCG62921 [Rattus norvegicus]
MSFCPCRVSASVLSARGKVIKIKPLFLTRCSREESHLQEESCPGDVFCEHTLGSPVWVM